VIPAGKNPGLRDLFPDEPDSFFFWYDLAPMSGKKPHGKAA